ncbi:hypothetical protein EDD17DRAFT_1766742 [Pisolithus thermaeus]|nr:hypothetical protein EDD17DRAFT_1766742 [Pisolithus thermaeus]
MNHSEDMLSLVQGGATCPSDDLFTTNSGELAALQDDSATGDQGIGSTPWGEYDHGGMGDYDYSGMGEDDGQVGEHVGDYDFQDQAGGTSYRRDNDFGRMSYRRDDDIGGTFDDVEMYEGTENDTDATSAGVQTWQETVPSGMQIRATPQTKCRTKSWDSRDTSKFTETSHCWGTHVSASGSALPSTSQPCHHFMSPYSQSSETSLMRGHKPAARGQLAQGGMSAQQLQQEAIHQRHEAKLIHRHQQESKQLDIKLTTAQTQLFEKQAEALCLQIMLAELEVKKHDGSASGGAGVSEHEAL